jgi:hypothetical protein
MQAAGMHVKDKSRWTILAPTDAAFTARLNRSLGITPAEMLKPNMRDTLEEVLDVTSDLTAIEQCKIHQIIHVDCCFPPYCKCDKHMSCSISCCLDSLKCTPTFDGDYCAEWSPRACSNLHHAEVTTTAAQNSTPSCSKLAICQKVSMPSQPSLACLAGAVIPHHPQLPLSELPATGLPATANSAQKLFTVNSKV